MSTTGLAASLGSAETEERIRRRAYFLWLNDGSPPSEDWKHWFIAQKHEMAAEGNEANTATVAGPHFSIGNTLAGHLSDPLHHFHAAAAHDRRHDVIAGEAPQRVRGRVARRRPGRSEREGLRR